MKKLIIVIILLFNIIVFTPSKADNYNKNILNEILYVVNMPNIKLEDHIGYEYCFKEPGLELLQSIKDLTFEESVIQILNSGIDIGYHTDCTGIRSYIVDDNIKMVKLILDNATEKNYKVTELLDVLPDIPILSLAAKLGREEIVDIILESDHIKNEYENIDNPFKSTNAETTRKLNPNTVSLRHYSAYKYSIVKQALEYALAYGNTVIADKLEDEARSLKKINFKKNSKEYKLWKQDILFSSVIKHKTVKAFEILHNTMKNSGFDNNYIKDKLNSRWTFISSLLRSENTSDALRYYIEKIGANVNRKIGSGKREQIPLCFAVRNRNYQGTKILLENGADLNLKINDINNFWDKCLYKTIYNGKKVDNNKIIELVESYIK